MVKFCPRCGGPLVPTRKNGTMCLKCTKCGFEIKASKKDSAAYGLKYSVEDSKRVATSRETEAREAKLTPEEREMLQEYYEVFLQEFAEEVEESGEGD